MSDQPGGRERILDAARGVFSERGYDAASISEIGARAGIAKSVMYHHFGSKAGLYEAIAEAETRGLIEHVSAAVPPRGQPRLRAGIDAYFAFIESRPAAWRLLVRDAPTDPELVAVHGRLGQKRSDAIAGLITPASSSGRKAGKGKAAHGELLTTAIRAFGSWWYDHPDVPREQVVDAVMDFSDASLKRIAGGV